MRCAVHYLRSCRPHSTLPYQAKHSVPELLPRRSQVQDRVWHTAVGLPLFFIYLLAALLRRCFRYNAYTQHKRSAWQRAQQMLQTCTTRLLTLDANARMENGQPNLAEPLSYISVQYRSQNSLRVRGRVVKYKRLLVHALALGCTYHGRPSFPRVFQSRRCV